MCVIIYIDTHPHILGLALWCKTLYTDSMTDEEFEYRLTQQDDLKGMWWGTELTNAQRVVFLTEISFLIEQEKRKYK